MEGERERNKGRDSQRKKEERKSSSCVCAYARRDTWTSLGTFIRFIR